MKNLIRIKGCSLVYLTTLVLLLSACRQISGTVEPVVHTNTPATNTPAANTGTPTNFPTIEPSPITAPATTEVSAGQVTPQATPSGSGNHVGWLKTDSAILRTTDGGESWVDVTPSAIREALSTAGNGGSGDFEAAFSQADYALAAYAMGNEAWIFRTSDGGQSWEESRLALQEEVQGITSMVLADEAHGWLLATRGVGAGNDWVDLYHTEDGGANWGFLAGSESEKNPAGGISSGGIKSGLSFSSPQKGWLTGSAPIDLVYLFRTLDGGLSWQPYHQPLPEGASFSNSSYPPIFFDENQGILPAVLITLSNEPGLLFYETQDGGETWVPIVLLEGEITAWDWVDLQHGFASGTDEQQQSKLFVTSDGGNSWEAYPVEMPVVRSLDFITDQVGWAVCGWAFDPREGCSGDVYHTKDRGRSWERVYP